MKPKSAVADTQLWNQLINNDPSAFKSLMQLYFKPMFRYGMRLKADEDLVRDCIQDVFASVWKRRQALPSLQSVRFYLLNALRKRILHELRRNKWVAVGNEVVEGYYFWAEYAFDTSLIAEEEATLNARKIELHLNALPPRQKEIIHLRFFQSLSHEEIAEIMGMSRQSVYNLLHGTLRRLRKQWIGLGLAIALALFV